MYHLQGECAVSLFNGLKMFLAHVATPGRTGPPLKLTEVHLEVDLCKANASQLKTKGLFSKSKAVGCQATATQEHNAGYVLGLAPLGLCAHDISVYIGL